MKAIPDIFERFPVSGEEDGFNDDAYYKYEITDANISQTHNAIKIDITIPESAKESYKIKIDKGILSISGSKIIDFELNLLNVTRTELNHSTFSSRPLQRDYFENEKIQVAFHHGLLTINIPKMELMQKLISEITAN